jgi:tetraacyldisaccharide 4'-kinase
MSTLARLVTGLYARAWEARRDAYARGWAAVRHAPARVVSVGNLAVGGTGKTTLTLALARAALEQGRDAVVVCRRYRPGPAGRGDEELLYAEALGESRVLAGRTKWRLAMRAALAGRDLVLVDDGFSHWPLARDVDIVLLDARDPWAGGLLPAGRAREPRRALQRAGWIVLSHASDDASARVAAASLTGWAPAARFAAGYHRVNGVRALDGRPWSERGAARIVTATGNPAAVERSATEVGFEPVRVSAYRDHHWFRDDEIARERAAAASEGATLLLTAKDAVRWPRAGGPAAVLDVAWGWWFGGEALTADMLGADES